MNSELLAKLSLPFHPSLIFWKPGNVNKERTKALAMPYATLRAYQNRLDEVCGLDWEVRYTPWNERIICHLTIAGVTRSSTGEPDEQSERSEIAGTAAEAQAFKRACSMFSLGRYLYYLPTLWVDYDAPSKQLTAAAKVKLTGILLSHYRRFDTNAPQITTHSAPEPDANTSGTAANQADAHAATDQAANQGSTTEAVNFALAVSALNAKGQVAFGRYWESAKNWLAERYTAKLTPDRVRHSLGDLSSTELVALTEGLAANTRYYTREWHKHRKAMAKTINIK